MRLVDDPVNHRAHGAHRVILGCLCGLGVLCGPLAGPLGAAQKTAAAKSADRAALAAMDYVEIEQLVARYAYALDTAADRGQAFARLFTPDGVLRVTGARGYEIKGREQLA